MFYIRWHNRECKKKKKTTKNKTKQKEIGPRANSQQQQICRLVDFIVPTDQRMKISESEKRDKY